MSFLLREVLLNSLGIESDINWGTSSNGISAIDIRLIPPSSGAIISKIIELGKNYKKIEEIIEKSVDNPYKQSIFDSIDNYLDLYRSEILKADEDINNEILNTLTGLISRLEKFHFEFQFILKILSNLITYNPIEMMNEIHNLVISSTLNLSETLKMIESSLQSVLITQLNGFLFYHQKIPELFQIVKNKKMCFITEITFLPRQLSDLLLFLLNISSNCNNLFENETPPLINNLFEWIVFVTKQMSTILTSQINNQWPSFHQILNSIYFCGRSDFISILSRRMLQTHITTFDLNFTFSKFDIKYNGYLELTSNGLSLKSKINSPLNLIVTEDYLIYLSEIFKILLYFSTSEESIKDLYRILKKYRKTFKIIHLIQHLLSSIKEYINFVIILPSITELNNNFKKYPDFIHFQQFFSNFIIKLINIFPVNNHNLIESASQLCNKLINLRELLIKKKMINNMNENSLLSILTEAIKNIIEHSNQILDIFNNGNEYGIHLSQRCIKIIENLEILVNSK